MSLRTVLLQTKKEAEEKANKRKAEEIGPSGAGVGGANSKRQKRKRGANPEDAEYHRLVNSHRKSTELLFTKDGHVQPSCRDPRAAGLFKKTLKKSDFQVLRNWYENVIKPSIPCMIEWGEGKKDPRRRGYVCLSESGGTKRLISEGIQMNPQGTYGKSAEKLNKRTFESSCVDVDSTKMGDDVRAVLENLCKYVRDRVERKYRFYVTLKNLVALQPNLHNETQHLPLHYDTPRHEGFGVVIVTVGMAGHADIIIVDDGDVGQTSKYYRFQVQAGDLYVLSGNARNKCVHGVLSQNCKYRESLNLRFGIHSKQFATSEIDCHWPWE